jgi:hypothetical protein
MQFENVTAGEINKKYYAFNYTSNLIILFAKSQHWALFRDSLIQPISSHSIF